MIETSAKSSSLEDSMLQAYTRQTGFPEFFRGVPETSSGSVDFLCSKQKPRARIPRLFFLALRS